MKHEKVRRGFLWFMTSMVGRVIRSLVYGAVGAFILLVVAVVLYLNSRPDLEPWHTADLDAEFTRHSDVTDLAGYLALEERLFKQLDAEVYEPEPPSKDMVNRFHRGSLSDPSRWPTNWNRTFERRAADPRAGVVMLHGLTDSPYSMRSLADALHAQGATVLALRVPGHGTAPAGLVDVRWEDWAAAVEIAVRHMDEAVGDRPLYIVGYSNGGALTVNYALSSLSDPSLRVPDGLVLMSPEIGITKLAALAGAQEWLGRVLRLRKMSWNSILLEYDPYKYESFALNAGRQAYRLTREIQSRITQLTKRGEMEGFPPVLAFQSVVDATVSAPALVNNFFERLPEGNHELVLFDLDRTVDIGPMFKRDPQAMITALFADSSRAFALTLVTNEAEGSHSVVARHAGPHETTTSDTPLGLTWPKDLYSLSHIALPFPPDDALYGGPDAGESPGVQLGNLVLRGETGVLAIGPANILRIHWNPFHGYLLERALMHTGLKDGDQTGGGESGRGETGAP